MQEQTIQTGESPVLTIRNVAGDLDIHGWESHIIQVRSDGDTVFDAIDNGFVVDCQGDCTLYAPVQTVVNLENLGGDGQIIDLSGSVTISAASGDLRIRNISAVTLRSVSGDLTIEQATGDAVVDNVGGDAQIIDLTGEITVGTVSGDLQLRNIRAITASNYDPDPEAGEISGDLESQRDAGGVLVESVGGDGQIIDLTGQAAVGKVGGDLLLQNTGPATAGTIGGDLTVRHVAGDIQIEQVGGDFAATEIRGSVTAHVGGDLSLARIDGPAHIQVGGDAAVHLAVETGYEQAVQAGGDIACRIPLDASVQVNMTSADRITVRDLPVTQTTASGTWEFVLGEGESTLNLLAGGAIVLSGGSDNRYYTGPEFGSFSAEIDIEMGREIAQRASDAAQQIASQFESRMDALGRQLDEKLSHIGDSDEIASHVQRHLQAAMRKVDHKVTEAVSDSERRARKAEHRAERAEARRRRHGSRRKEMKPQRAPKPKREPVTNEERMTILRMVEEGKISVEQAEQLLAALG